jgi:hypothetical protein
MSVAAAAGPAAIRWDPRTRLVISDVDDTIAGVYQPAAPGMIAALKRLLGHGVLLFLVSGCGLANLNRRVVGRLPAALKRQVLVGHCNGAEVVGFDERGEPYERPLFSAAALPAWRIDPIAWRLAVRQLLQEFDLVPYPVMELEAFRAASHGDQRAVMVDDRGVQLSLMFGNRLFGSPPPDLRPELVARAHEHFRRRGLGAVGRIVGVDGVDFVADHVHKGLPVRALVAYGPAFRDELPERIVLGHPEEAEVWGDRFGAGDQGADLCLALALRPGSRVISFRPLAPKDRLHGTPIRCWPGGRQLHEGLREYLAQVPAPPGEEP